MTGIKNDAVHPVLRGIQKLWTGAEETGGSGTGERDH